MKLQNSIENGVGVLLVTGSLNFISAPQLEMEAKKLLGAGVLRILVDIRQTVYLDSTGLGVLVRIQKHVVRCGGGAAIVVKSDGLAWRILGMTRAEEFLHLFQSRKEALAYLKTVHPKKCDVSGARIFILCRSESRADWFRRCVSENGCRNVSVTRTASDAEEMLRKEHFDVLVIDELQPLSSARSFLDNLHGENRNAPLVIANPTAPPDEEQIRGGAAAEKEVFMRQIQSAIRGAEPSYITLIESGIAKEFLRRFGDDSTLDSPAH